MADVKTRLQKRIEDGGQILIAEIIPPLGSDATEFRAAAKRLGANAHALGVADNRHGVAMSALAAASLVASECLEPILHMTTRDRNRMALVSDCLGALALGVGNILCTSGTHQTLGRCRAAKNVYDIDATVLLQTLAGLRTNALMVGEERIETGGPFCLGAVASPCADPLELQQSRLAGKIHVGARFVVTQPVFDLERFDAWWKDTTARGLHDRAAIVAGVEVLTDAESAKEYARERPSPMIPDSVIERLAAKKTKDAQRQEGLQIAIETVERLRSAKGLRGFEISSDDAGAAAELMARMV